MPFWGEPDRDRQCLGPRFGDGHYGHGWGCAFKGDGHRNLVSRRWLEHGPWQLVRGANDVSLVLFHDLNADPATALEQAKPSHQRMGISPEGGYIQSSFVYRHDLSGMFEPSRRRP